MPDFDLTITVASWNTRDPLRACLQSLQDLRGELPFEVIVLDNASGDGSPDVVREEFPWVTLIASETNTGFGAAHNRAMERGSGRYLLVLNSDAVVAAGTLQGIVEFAERNPKIGVFGPKILNPNGTLQYSCRRFPTIQAALFRNTLLGRLFPRNRYTADYLMSEWPHDQPRQVDWVSGAAMVVRREVFEQLGGFDEQFFMYCEDVDLCLRARQAGWETWYVPAGGVTHEIGRSTSQIANKAIRMFHHSMWLFYRKHYIHQVAPILRPLVPFGLWVRATAFIAKNGLDALMRRLRGR
jgi:GT2 family glycosyltransferase